MPGAREVGRPGVCVEPALAHPNVTLLTDAYVSRLETSASGREVTRRASSTRNGAPETLRRATSSSCRAARSTRRRCCCAPPTTGTRAAWRTLRRRRAPLHGSRQLGADGGLEVPEPDDVPEDARRERLLLRLEGLRRTRWATSRSSASSTRSRCRRARRRSRRVHARPDGEALARLLADVGGSADPDNRVTLDRDGNIVLSYTPNNEEGHKRLHREARTLHAAAVLPEHGHECHQGLFSRNLFVGQRIPLAGVAHQNGTSASATTRRRRRSTRLASARRRQPLRRRRQLLPVERRGEPGADDHGERAARRRPPARAAGLTRRAEAVVRAVALFAARVCAVSRLAPRAARRSQPLVAVASRRVGMTVSDMERSVAFFTNVLTFEKVSDDRGRRERVRAAARRVRGCACESCGCGSATSRSSSPSTWRRAGGRFPSTRAATIAGSSTSRSSCRDMDARLRAAAAARRGARLDRSRSGCRTGTRGRRHQGVLLQGSGRPLRWRSCSSRRARAIRSGTRRTGSCSSASTTPRSSSPTPSEPGASIATRWGFASLVRATNYGPEQERLNNVFGARLRITVCGRHAAGHRVPRVSRAA